MPEGHTLHRLAADLTERLGGRQVVVTSPQGRFAAGAELVDGDHLLGARAHGKHLFLDFAHDRLVHVHLGLYGKLRIADGAPPPPRGQVRMRLATRDTPESYADLRGATACEVLTREEQGRVLDRLGPDPLHEDADWTRAWDRVRRSRSSLAALLMDQGVLAGVGNVYRAELLFRHRLDPARPGRTLTRSRFEALWRDLVVLMSDGVRRGRIDTVRVPHPEPVPARVAAAHPGRSRVWVYRRHGEACFVCGARVRTEVLAARNLFWCPRCQKPFRSRAGERRQPRTPRAPAG